MLDVSKKFVNSNNPNQVKIFFFTELEEEPEDINRLQLKIGNVSNYEDIDENILQIS